jgi:hypothetical protein
VRHSPEIGNTTSRKWTKREKEEVETLSKWVKVVR